MTWGKLPQIKVSMTEPYTLKDFIDEYIHDHPEIDSYNKFAQRIGVASSTILDVVKGKHKPGIDFLTKMADATNTDFILLVQIAYPEQAGKGRSSPSSQLLAERINRLPDPLRNMLIRLIRSYDEE